jgi:flavin-dependent dehydrogenase
MQNPPTNDIDVTVIGCGIAGMAACIHLRDAGLKVLCIEPQAIDDDPVGESLDWSAPALLEALGLPMNELLQQGVATYKRHVVLRLADGSEQHYVPGEWLGKPPYNVNLSTMHVDRTMLNQALRQRVIDKGVVMLNDKVVNVETSGRRVVAITTAGGERINSPWFLDASGSHTSLLPRLFRSPAHEYGPNKVAMWEYFTVTKSIEGTTLHTNSSGAPYMEWVWQIPVHPDAVSVGYVCPGEGVKEKRRQGMSVADIFQERVAQLPELGVLMPSAAGRSPRTTSFRCRVFQQITGPNWLAIGEAAAMVDPMTSNGVTAAIRHAADAARLIIRYHKRRSLPYLPAAMYQLRVTSLARFFNGAIEKVLYERPIRNRIGAFRAGDVYTIPAWSLNVIYSRLQPQGILKTLLFGGLVTTLRAAVHVFYTLCRWTHPSQRVDA